MSKPKALACMMIILTFVLAPFEAPFAGLQQNGVEILIDSDGYVSNTMPTSEYDKLLFTDWNDNYYFGCSNYECSDEASIHQVIRIQNQSAYSGILIVRLDILNNDTGMTTYWFKYGDPVTGAANSRFIELSQTFARLTENFSAQHEITIVDIIGALSNDGPMIMTAMLLDADNQILGVDSKTIYFRTDFMTWIAGPQ